MSKEGAPQLESDAERDERVFKERAAYEQANIDRAEKIKRMFQLADDIGSGGDKSPMTGEMWFKTWQDALDFQAHCEENGLPLNMIEVDAKPVSWGGDYYKLFPKK